LGTALVLASYTQKSLPRLRRLSLTASVVLIVFNAALGVWSNVALEVALVGVNLHLLRRGRSVPVAAADSTEDLVSAA
jgi:hypothetical protein